MPQKLIRTPTSGQEAEKHGKDEAEMLRDFFRNHGQTLAIALGVCLAIALGYGAYRNHRRSMAFRASQILMGARSAEELQQVITQYPSAPTTPLAMLSLAARYYDEGQYEMARFAYQQFEQKHSGHPLFEVAALGQAQCLEAEGRFDEALQAYDALAGAKPDHFLVPLARLGKARTLLQAGRHEDARIEYEDFISAHPDSEWTSLAESALLFVDKDVRAAAKGIVEPPLHSIPFAPSAPPSPFAGMDDVTGWFPAEDAPSPLPPAEEEPAR